MTNLILSFVFISLTTSLAHAEKWKVATLEWPPFTCEKCPDQGAGTKALKEALKSVGIELEVVWLPWTRAINESKNKAYAGFWPAWPEDAGEGFLRSEPVFSSPFGIAEQMAKPLQFKSLNDLSGKTIASVQDYGNTKEFNELLDKGVIKKDIGLDDSVSLKKLGAGRVDGAIIDSNVFNHMITYDLPDLKGKLKMNSNILENKTLGISFGIHDGQGKNLNEKLKEALKKVDTQKIVDEYLTKHFKK